MNTIEIFQIFLVAVLLAISYIIVRSKIFQEEKTDVKPIQVAIPTAVFVASILIMNEIKIIENVFVRIVIAISIYFIVFYIIKFTLEYMENINIDQK